MTSHGTYRDTPFHKWLWSRGITLRQLGMAAQMNHGYISEMAKGRRAFSSRVRDKLMSALRSFSHLSEMDLAEVQRILDVYVSRTLQQRQEMLEL